MTIEEILKGMSCNISLETHVQNQGYTAVKNTSNYVIVTEQDDRVIFNFKVYYLNYEQWNSGNYRSPYICYTNNSSVSYAKEQLQNFSSEIIPLINLYNRLNYSVSNNKEWREIMRYFWKDWDFPETDEKKELKQSIEDLSNIINENTFVSIANKLLEQRRLLNRLFPD